MSEEGGGQPSEASKSAALDFERAELPAHASTMSCASCKRDIAGTYYSINTSYVCPACHTSILEATNRAGSFPAAVMLGTGAAALGALLYYVISLTGYEFGIIAIAVGVFVGKAVRKGAGMRASPVYRVVAVVLTYIAMTATYVPMLLKSEGISSVAHALFIAVQIPFYTVSDNFLGLIILGIGLYEAWKLSAPPIFRVEGPFTREATAPELSPVAADSTLL